MADGSTTGTNLYKVGTGVIGGDLGAGMRQQARKQIETEALERKKRKELNQKYADKAMENLGKIQVSGHQADIEYLTGLKNELTTEYTEVLKMSEGRPSYDDQSAHQSAISDLQALMTRSEQNGKIVEQQEALLTNPANADEFTDESIAELRRYQELPPETRLMTEVPRLKPIIDPEDWYKPFILDKENKFTKSTSYADIKGDIKKTGSGTVYDANRANVHINNILEGAFNPEIGTKTHKAFREFIEKKFDRDPDASAQTIPLGEKRDAALKEYAKDYLETNIKSVQKTGRTSANIYDLSDKGGKSDDETTPYTPEDVTPGTQSWGWDGTESNYTDQYSVGFDTGDKGYGEINVTHFYDEDGVRQDGKLLSIEGSGVVQEGHDNLAFKKRGLGGSVDEEAKDVLIVKYKDQVTEKNEIGDPKVVTVTKTATIPLTPENKKQLNTQSKDYKKVQKDKSNWTRTNQRPTTNQPTVGTTDMLPE